MKDVVIWDIPLPEVTLEEVFQAEGADYSNRSPRPSTLEIHRRILAEATDWVTPKAIWREVDIKRVNGQDVYLEDEKVLNSPLLSKMAVPAEKLLLFAVTIGEGIEERLSQYKNKGNLSETFILDAAGTAYLTKISMVLLKHLEVIYHGLNMKTTFPMGPGHSYWNRIEDLQAIFHYLKSEQIGLRLTESNFILPRKSVAMVICVGHNLPDSHGKTHCTFCSLQATCPLSQSKKECTRS